MIITSTIVIDVTAHRWGRTYDAAELDRRAADALSQARPGGAVRLVVRDLLPAPVPESLSWARPDLAYFLDVDTPAVSQAWEVALKEAQAVNHGR